MQTKQAPKKQRVQSKVVKVKERLPQSFNSAKEMAEYYRANNIPIKPVKFNNGRVYNTQRPPYVLIGYRDQFTGLSNRIANQVVYDANGEMIMIPSGAGGTLQPQRYGQEIKFMSNASVSLNPIVHFDVIKLVRNYRETASPYKSDGYPEVTTGKITEIAPEMFKKKEWDKFQLQMEADQVKIALFTEGNERTLGYVIALTNNMKDDEVEEKLALNAYVQNNPDAFLELFEDKDYDSPVVKPSYINVAIVKRAIQKKAIEWRNGQYFIGDASLGTSASKIHIDYEKYMGAIKSELDRIA